MLQAIAEGRVHLSAEITADGLRSHDGLAEARFRHHHRINKYWNCERAIFSENGVHIDGTENFWNTANAATPRRVGCEKAAFRCS